MRKILFLSVEIVLLLIPSYVSAGPPYDTDDPEPVELHHWEFYVASHSTHDDNGWNATLPHFEVNYGAAPNLQVHAILPMGYNETTGGENSYGLSDIELGAKYRFVKETESIPMIGIFPLVELPSGNSTRGLGNGKTQFYIPLWLQKDLGKWTTYGGAGYWINTAEDSKNWVFIGWQIQNQVTKSLSIGGELYHTSPEAVGSDPETRFNLGFVYDINKNNHLMFSAGKGIQGPVKAQIYAAYQLTL
jgi:hypothetical protein